MRMAPYLTMTVIFYQQVNIQTFFPPICNLPGNSCMPAAPFSWACMPFFPNQEGSCCGKCSLPSIWGHVYKAFIYEWFPGPASAAPAWRWLGGLSEISLRGPRSTTDLYSFSSADLHHTVSQPAKFAMTWEWILPFKKKQESGLIFLSFPQQPQSYCGQRCLLWSQAAAVN